MDELAADSEALVGGEIRNAVLVGLASCADRSGAERMLLPTDRQAAIEHVRRANRDVGTEVARHIHAVS